MPYSVNMLANILKEIKDSGIDFVVIGDTVVFLELRYKKFEGDIDLFVTNMSPFVEEENIRSIAEERGWGFSYTDIGTPRIIIGSSEGDIVVELYENIHDFYIPEEILASSKKIKLKNTEVNVLHVEDYILLKARAGGPEDLEKLAKVLELLNSKNYKINQRLLKAHLDYFPKEEQNLIASRIKSLGIKI